MTFSLRGVSIPNDGSGHVLITDINPNGDNNETALICRSEAPTTENGNWFLSPTHMTTNSDNRLNPQTANQGWLL